MSLSFCCGAACACRSREGAWIEMRIKNILIINSLVAPVRERGLKLLDKDTKIALLQSLP